MSSYSQTIKLVQGDSKPNLVVTVADSSAARSGAILDSEDPSTWAPIDISGASVSMFVREVGGSSLKATLNGTISDGPNGVVVFTYTTSTWDAVGVFEGEVQITFSDGGIQTVQKFIKFIVREQVG